MASNEYLAEGGDAYQGYLNDSCETFAQIAKNSGYYTGQSGKWHVGVNPAAKPNRRGFMTSISGSGFYFPEGEVNLELDGTAILPTDSRLPSNWYSTDLWTQFTLKYIDEAKLASKPFLCYLAFNAPHFPVQAPQEDIMRFRGKLKEIGWNQMRQNRYEKQLSLNVFDKALSAHATQSVDP